MCEYALEFGFGTIPNGVGEELYSYDRSTAERGGGVDGGFYWVPDSEDIGLLGKLVSCAFVDMGVWSEGGDRLLILRNGRPGTRNPTSFPPTSPPCAKESRKL